MTIRTTVQAGLAMLVGAGSAADANLIVNAGFEAPTLAPWFTTPDALITPTASVNALGSQVALISFESPFAAGAATLSQTFTTSSAGIFDYSFSLGRGDGGGFADYGLFFQANIDGTELSTALPALGGCCGVNNIPLQSFSGWLFLAAGSHQINFNFARSFTLFGRSPFLLLDGVSVTAATPAVPEPSSWAMMIAGFGLAGAVARRRTQVSFA